MLYMYAALLKTQGSHCREDEKRGGQQSVPKSSAQSQVKTAERPDALLSAQIRMIKPSIAEKQCQDSHQQERYLPMQQTSLQRTAVPAGGLSLALTAKICSSQKLA